MNISIHAPTRGATISSSDFANVFDYFNPRSYKRSDSFHTSNIFLCCYFNPRSYKRSDKKCLTIYVNFILFQSTLLQEERQYRCHYFSTNANFNPRSYKRSDLLTIKIILKFNNFNPRSYKRSDYN